MGAASARAEPEAVQNTSRFRLSLSTISLLPRTQLLGSNAAICASPKSKCEVIRVHDGRFRHAETTGLELQVDRSHAALVGIVINISQLVVAKGVVPLIALEQLRYAIPWEAGVLKKASLQNYGPPACQALDVGQVGAGFP